MNKLEKSIKILSDFCTIDGASANVKDLEKALKVVVKAARTKSK